MRERHQLDRLTDRAQSLLRVNIGRFCRAITEDLYVVHWNILGCMPVAEHNDIKGLGYAARRIAPDAPRDRSGRGRCDVGNLISMKGQDT